MISVYIISSLVISLFSLGIYFLLLRMHQSLMSHDQFHPRMLKSIERHLKLRFNGKYFDGRQMGFRIKLAKKFSYPGSIVEEGFWKRKHFFQRLSPDSEDGKQTRLEIWIHKEESQHPNLSFIVEPHSNVVQNQIYHRAKISRSAFINQPKKAIENKPQGSEALVASRFLSSSEMQTLISSWIDPSLALSPEGTRLTKKNKNRFFPVIPVRRKEIKSFKIGLEICLCTTRLLEREHISYLPCLN